MYLLVSYHSPSLSVFDGGPQPMGLGIGWVFVQLDAVCFLYIQNVKYV